MNDHGMTKIEIAIILLIVGLLGIFAVVAVTSARSRTRDVTRLAHVRDVQTGLELYFNDHSAYPSTKESAVALGQAFAACLGDKGFAGSCSDTVTPYLSVVPVPPTSGLGGESTCEGVPNAYCFQSDSEVYRIQFELERQNPILGLVKGANCATESGIEPGICSALTSTPN